jgi:purine nucleoside phosphorylase
MARLAVVGGNATRGLDLPDGDWVYLQRHGEEGYALPHEIEHEANMRRLAEAGCDRVLAIGSVGGLRTELGPGTFASPDDFIALDMRSPSTYTDIRAHGVLGFEAGWRERVVTAWTRLAEVPLRDGGVYWQANGPRLETPAEIRLIAAHADVIGMTIASECVIARELGLAYAAVCVVDNLANGVGDRELTIEELEAGRVANRGRLASALATVLPALAAQGQQ